MTEWTDDRRDESADDQHNEADDQHDDRDEPDESGDQLEGEQPDSPTPDQSDSEPSNYSDSAPPDHPDDESPDRSSDDDVPDSTGSEGPDSESESADDDSDRESGGGGDDDTDREPDGRQSPSRDPHTQTGTNDTSEGDNWLSSLIDALDRLDRGSSSGQHRSDRTVLDYDISIGTGLDAADDESSERSFESRSSRDADRGQPRKSRGVDASDAAHLTTRSSAEELLVTVDVASLDPEEITVGFDDGVLVLAVSGQELDRIDVPWRDRSADATIKNGILTVRVTPEADSTSEVDDDA